MLFIDYLHRHSFQGIPEGMRVTQNKRCHEFKTLQSIVQKPLADRWEYLSDPSRTKIRLDGVIEIDSVPIQKAVRVWKIVHVVCSTLQYALPLLALSAIGVCTWKSIEQRSPLKGVIAAATALAALLIYQKPVLETGVYWAEENLRMLKSEWLWMVRIADIRRNQIMNGLNNLGVFEGFADYRILQERALDFFTEKELKQLVEAWVGKQRQTSSSTADFCKNILDQFAQIFEHMPERHPVHGAIQALRGFKAKMDASKGREEAFQDNLSKYKTVFQQIFQRDLNHADPNYALFMDFFARVTLDANTDELHDAAMSPLFSALLLQALTRPGLCKSGLNENKQMLEQYHKYRLQHAFTRLFNEVFSSAGAPHDLKEWVEEQIQPQMDPNRKFLINHCFPKSLSK